MLLKKFQGEEAGSYREVRDRGEEGGGDGVLFGDRSDVKTMDNIGQQRILSLSLTYGQHYVQRQ